MATVTINRTTPAPITDAIDWDNITLPMECSGAGSYEGFPLLVTKHTGKGRIEFYHIGPNSAGYTGRDSIHESGAARYLGLPKVQPEQPVVESVTITMSVEQAAAIRLLSGEGQAHFDAMNDGKSIQSALNDMYGDLCRATGIYYADARTVSEAAAKLRKKV